MRKYFFKTGLRFLWVTLLILLLDRATKLWALSSLLPYESRTISPFFNLTLAYNTGAAFSFLNSASGWQNILLGGLAVLMSIIIIIWLAKTPATTRCLNFSLAFILGGALGNLWDRILYGYVIDFLHFHIKAYSWPIFNIADSFICIGAFLLFWCWSRSQTS